MELGVDNYRLWTYVVTNSENLQKDTFALRLEEVYDSEKKKTVTYNYHDLKDIKSNDKDLNFYYDNFKLIVFEVITPNISNNYDLLAYPTIQLKFDEKKLDDNSNIDTNILELVTKRKFPLEVKNRNLLFENLYQWTLESQYDSLNRKIKETYTYTDRKNFSYIKYETEGKFIEIRLINFEEIILE